MKIGVVTSLIYFLQFSLGIIKSHGYSVCQQIDEVRQARYGEGAISYNCYNNVHSVSLRYITSGPHVVHCIGVTLIFYSILLYITWCNIVFILNLLKMPRKYTFAQYDIVKAKT